MLGIERMRPSVKAAALTAMRMMRWRLISAALRAATSPSGKTTFMKTSCRK